MSERTVSEHTRRKHTMCEQEIQNRIRLAISSPERIVFRTNAGEFWQGKQVYSQEFGQNVLINLRKIDGLPKGFSDLIVIDRQGIAFIETKTLTWTAREHQQQFLATMRNLGHRAGIARSVEDATAIMEGRYDG